MADPLSIAASIAGLVSLADIVFARLVKYGRSVKNADKEIQDLSKEVNLLGGALNSLARLARSLEEGSFDTNLRMRNIEHCSDTLLEMNKKLAKLENPSMRQKLSWPFSKDRVKEWLDELSQHKANINLALSANSLDVMLRLLAQTETHATEILAEVKQTRRITSRIHEDDHRRKVLDFFLKYNPQQNYDMSLRLRHPRTGLWLTRLPEFRQWLTTPDSKLWLKGIPGAGKTVLAATIIESALEKNTETTPTAFFFCDYKDTKTQVVENILGALVYQLAIQKEDAYGMLEEYCNELHPKTGLPKQASRRGLEKLLGKMLTVYDHAYFVIDGLDECGNSTGDVVDTLLGLSEDADNISIALLSRDEDEIRDRLEGDFVPIEVAAHKGDITEYVTAEIEERIRTRKLHISGPDLKGEILHGLVDGAKGMFRWVACQLDHLGDCDSDQQCREALMSLPPTLNETYARILGRVPKSKQGLTELTLNCVAHASPKLTIRQLREMLSVPAPGEFLKDGAVIREEAITRYCSSLVRKSTQDGHLEFSHFSVQEFLEKDLQELGFGWIQVSRRRAYHLMAIECLKFVQLKNFDRPEIKPKMEEEQIESRDRLYPLYGHASERWPVYAREVWESQAIFDFATSLFHPSKTSYFTSWAIHFAYQSLDKFTGDSGVLENLVDIFINANYTPLHMAAALSLPQICSFLVGEGARLNLESPLGRPLQCAVQGVRFHRNERLDEFRGRSTPPCVVATVETIRYLCRAGASLDFMCCYPFTGISLVRMSLQLVAQMENFQPLTALVQEGACVEEADIPHEHEIFSKYWVKSPEYEANLQEFLEFLDSCDHHPPGHYRLISMLWRHAISNKLSITSDPMRVDTRVSLTIDELKKEAAAAVLARHSKGLERILRDPRFDAARFVDHDGDSLMHLALGLGRNGTKDQVDVINLLLEAGCDATKPDKNGMDPLQRWALWFRNGEPSTDNLRHVGEVAQLLTNSGASCTHQDSQGRNVFHHHLHSPFLLSALLKAQSPDNTKKAMEAVDSAGFTPLALSLLKQCPEAASIFLSQPTTITAQMVRSPISVLSLAVSACDEASFEALLLSGIDFRFHGTETPLHHVRCDATLPFVRRLKFLYPKACETQYRGRTPLQSYLEQYFEAGFRGVSDASVMDELTIPETTSANKTVKAFTWDKLVSLILKYGPAVKLGWARSVEMKEGEEKINVAIMSLIRGGYLEAFKSFYGWSGILPLLQGFGASSGLSHLSSLSITSIHEILSQTPRTDSVWQSPQIIRLLKAIIDSNNLENLGLLTLMLEKGVSVHQRCDGSSALERFVSNATTSEEMLDILLQHSDKSLLNDINPDGNGLGLIHLLGATVSDSLVKKIVDHGADPNMRVAKYPNRPALLYYIRKGQAKCAIAILKVGADPTLLDDLGYDAALTAVLLEEVSVLAEIYYSAAQRSINNDWYVKMNWHRRSGLSIYAGNTEVECFGVTALHLAASCEFEEILSFYGDHRLMEDFDTQSDEGYTPLHFAASHGSSANIEYLCARGCNVDARAQDGSSPLHLAVRNNKAEAVKALISAGCRSFPDSAGITPFLYANMDQANNEELISLLNSVEKGSSPSKNDSQNEKLQGSTLALSFRAAVKKGDLKLCQRLVTDGFNLETPLSDSPRGSSLIEAIDLKQVEIIEWMTKQKVSMTTPICDSEFELAIHLVLGDADLAEVTSASLQNYMRNGGRLLEEIPGVVMTAVEGGSVEVLKTLLQHAKDNQDHYGRLWSMHSDRVVSTLVNESEEFTGATPLHQAAHNGNLITVKLLLEWGANINTPDAVYEESPLHCAIKSPEDTQESVALFLIEQGADLECCDEFGNTPANLAATQGRMRSLQVLIKAQAGLHTPNEFSETILDCIIQSEEATKWKAFTELRHLGVDPHTVHSSGYSAIHDVADTSDSVSLLLNSDLFRLEDATPYPWNAIQGAQLVAFISTAYPLFQRRFGRHALQRFANLMPTTFDSPLCKAARQGSVSVLKNLLQLGASIDWEGCPSGSALMAACESGAKDAIYFLVRRGAALSYTGPNGFRSAFFSAKRHRMILHWLLVDRFVDQHKLTSGPHCERSDDDVNPGSFSWGGPVKVELVISGRMERLHHESSREYWSRLMEQKVEFRGKIPPLNAGRRTVFRSCLIPQETVRIHPQGYNPDASYDDGLWPRLQKDGKHWYISYAEDIEGENGSEGSNES